MWQYRWYGYQRSYRVRTAHGGGLDLLNLFQNITLLANFSRLLADSAICGFVVNHDSINRSLERNPVLVTALNPVIGYELGAATAKQAYKGFRD